MPWLNGSLYHIMTHTNVKVRFVCLLQFDEGRITCSKTTEILLTGIGRDARFTVFMWPRDLIKMSVTCDSDSPCCASIWCLPFSPSLSLTYKENKEPETKKWTSLGCEVGVYRNTTRDECTFVTLSKGIMGEKMISFSFLFLFFPSPPAPPPSP